MSTSERLDMLFQKIKLENDFFPDFSFYKNSLKDQLIRSWIVVGAA